MSRIIVMLTLLLLAIVTIVLGFVAGGLVSNRPPMMDPPGFRARLAVYLGSNVAETRAGHPFQELRPRRYPLDAERLYAASRDTLRELGWALGSEDPGAHSLKAVITTGLWRFQDDVQVRIEGGVGEGTVWVRSSSRVGRGDLAANTRHVLDFYAGLERHLRAAGPEM